MVNLSILLNLARASCASFVIKVSQLLYMLQLNAYTFTAASSTKPYRQLSLVRLSLARKTRRMLPGRAPAFATLEVEATFTLAVFPAASFKLEEDSSNLRSFDAPFERSSSVTLASRPRKRRNCEGVASIDTSLSPIFRDWGILMLCVRLMATVGSTLD